MKKLISLLLLALALTFAGCGAPAQTPAEPVPAAAEEPAAESVEAVPAQEPEAVPGTETEAQAAEETPESTTLVVYFSATGTTRSVAERIAALTGAALCEIVPAEPYTAEDLNYGDHSTRATVEQNDPAARPEIANEISLDGCTTLTNSDYVLNLPTTVTDVFAARPSHLVSCLAAKLWSNATEMLSCSGNCGVEELQYNPDVIINSPNNVQFTMRSNGTLSDNSPALRMNIYKNTEDPTGSNFSIAGNTNTDYMPWADVRTNLTAVVIEDGVEGIGNNAFAGCTALTTFRVMPTTAPALGTNVFDGCTALTIIAPASYKTADGWKSEGIVEKLRADREDLFAGGKEWMTWCGDFDWSAPAGCKVYVVGSVDESTVTLTALTETANADRTEGEEEAGGIRIPAYTPVILQKTVANATGLQARFAKVGTVPTSGYNATTGLVTKTETDFSMLGAAKDAPVSGSITAGYSYALFDGEFLKIDDSTLSIPAHRCILTLPEPLSASRLSIVDGTQTGIGHTEITEITERTGAWYTLDGRKLDKQPTTKGLYIYKGKKVVIK